MTLLELAARVEAATGADRELDADILAAVFPNAFEKLRIEAGMPSGAPDAMMTAGARDYVKYRSRYWFSSSFDAAMTLVPEGINLGGERFKVEAWDGNGIHAPHVRASAWVAGSARVYAATPALALTAAALRALANKDTTNG